jgi:hypothetical protein
MCVGGGEEAESSYEDLNYYRLIFFLTRYRFRLVNQSVARNA